MTVIVFGLPGAGKSYLARMLASRIDADYVNSDGIRKTMFANRTYSDREKLSVYDEMLAQARHSIRQGKSLVLDATFYKDAIRQKFMNAAGDNVLFIEVKADETVIKKRLEQRRTDSEADFRVYQNIRSQFEPMTEPHLILSSANDNVDEMLNQAFDYLKMKDDKRRD
jgi:predicted kinase